MERGFPAVFSDVGFDFIHRQFLAAALARRLYVLQQLLRKDVAAKAFPGLSAHMTVFYAILYKLVSTMPAQWMTTWISDLWVDHRIRTEIERMNVKCHT